MRKVSSDKTFPKIITSTGGKLVNVEIIQASRYSESSKTLSQELPENRPTESSWSSYDSKVSNDKNSGDYRLENLLKTDELPSSVDTHRRPLTAQCGDTSSPSCRPVWVHIVVLLPLSVDTHRGPLAAQCGDTSSPSCRSVWTHIVALLPSSQDAV
ncbi:hypothetical protein J6590_067264 [Homalodisca vitripennis]|nr:hypothetical protein J6590_067264 [Homalodisca vitripennis]